MKFPLTKLGALVVLIAGLANHAHAQGVFNKYAPQPGIQVSTGVDYHNTAAAASDVTTLWGSTPAPCSSLTFLRGDGNCAVAGGGNVLVSNGTVTTNPLTIGSTASVGSITSIPGGSTQSWTPFAAQNTNSAGYTAIMLAGDGSTSVSGDVGTAANTAHCCNIPTGTHAVALLYFGSTVGLGTYISAQPAGSSAWLGTSGIGEPLCLGTFAHCIWTINGTDGSMLNNPAFAGTSNTALAVNGVNNGGFAPALSVAGVSNSGFSGGVSIAAGTNSSDYVISAGPVVGGSTLNFKIVGDGSGFLGRSTSSTAGKLRWDSTGAFTLSGMSSSSSSPALSIINGAGGVVNQPLLEVNNLGTAYSSNTFVARMRAATTASVSSGLYIGGGTNTSDFALQIQNAAESTDYLDIVGDGGVTIGAPTGGDKGLGSVNAQALYVNNNAVLKNGTLVTVPQGGTGVGTVTGILQGNGTSAVSAITDSSTTGQTLRVTGASTYGWGALDVSSANAVVNVMGAAHGGTASAFTAFSGPASSIKTFTLPNVSATILTTNDTVTVPQGGTGEVAFTAHGVLLGEGSTPVSNVAAMALDTLLQGQGTGADPIAVVVNNCGSPTTALSYSTSTHTFGCQTISTGGSGTVTSVAAGTGITASPSPITGSGTISINQAAALTWTGAENFTAGSGVSLTATSPAAANEAISLGCISGTFSATANPCLTLRNSSASAQTPIDFFTSSTTLTGRIRNDSAGNLAYIAFSSGAHAFFTGGDSGVGTRQLNIASGGIQAGSPTGGAEGAGTINAMGLFVNGVAAATTLGRWLSFMRPR